MQLRDYKSQENTDKRHDVFKAFEDKKKKIERIKSIWNFDAGGGFRFGKFKISKILKS